MEDIYEYTNRREDIPQAKYVQEHRELSESIVIEVAEQLQKVKHYTEQEIYSYNENPQTDARKLLYLTEIPYNYTGLKVVVNDNSTTYSDYFKIVFETPKQETQQSQQVETQSTEAANTGKIQIVDYSNKAIAVIGDTKPIKELLKSLGGSFNPRLSCGAGWIFSKKKLEEVQTALINHAKTSTEEPQPENINLPVLYTSTPSNVQNIEEAEIIEETPTGKALSLEYFKILWHEGKQNPYFTGAIFTDWQEVQKVFYKLWEVNEKGQNGGYTKVKCEIKFKGVEAVTDRIDITNRVNNGDFNPSQRHVLE